MTENLQASRTRREVLVELASARIQFEQSSSNSKYRLDLARLLYEAGEFWEAKDLLAPLEPTAQDAGTCLQAAKLAYLTGDYRSAENLVHSVLSSSPADDERKQAYHLKMLSCYQMRRYQDAAVFFKEVEYQSPLLDLMRAYGERQPYTSSWQSIRKTILLFIITDPLPLVRVVINGHEVYSLIDTGGNTFYLDPQIAAAIGGIETAAESLGVFGGGKKATTTLAVAETMQLGEVSLCNVPVTLLPLQQLSPGFAEGKFTIGGIVGTGVLRQFLSTLDYPGGRLVLREKAATARQDWLSDASGKKQTEIPFVMAGTHFMMAKGSLNELDRLTFFIDSGLASEAAMSTPIQTLQYTGIPEPRRVVDEKSIGGGGGVFSSAVFPIQRLGLGPLMQYNLQGEYGALTPERYRELGFINDGILSHRFLREYSWTLDFDTMKMIFVERKEY